MATKTSSSSSPWRRGDSAQRLLVVEHPDGSIEEKGFVRVLTLISIPTVDDPEIRSAIEWQDPEHGPRGHVLDQDDYDDDEGKLCASIVHTREDGSREIWHFDEAAQSKIREALLKSA